MPASRLSGPVLLPLGLVLLALLWAATARAQAITARTLRNTGPNASRVNVAILGDGFTEAQQEQFFAAAQAKLNVLVNNESFAAVKDIMNGVAVFTASNESGTDIAADGITRDTYYDTGFTGSVNARLLTVATAAGRTRATNILREHAPDYDISIVLVNSTIYGGAGGTLAVASLHNSSDEVLLHEIGHSFAKLADEYVDAVSAPNYPPAESANATQKTARAELAWVDFILDSTPVPTPVPNPATNTDVNHVGLWEGAHYRATGFYRPVYDSKMRSLGRPFGPVNVRAYAVALHRLNLNGATSAPTRLALAAPTASAPVGGRLSLGASAEGTGPFTYQWIRNGKFIAGQTEATLTIASVNATHVGAYGVEITNAAGTTTSLAAGIATRIDARGTGAGAAYDVTVGTQPVVRWVATAPYVAEQGGAVVLAVSRAGNVAGPLSIPFSTTAGSATAPGDFTAQTGILSWADGDSADKTITIAIVSDTLAEALETFTVTLGTPSAGIVAGSAVATVTIADSGTRDPTFTANFVNNAVTRLVPQPDGSILIAGFFSTLQDAFFLSYPYGRIARLKPDGIIDPSFKPGVGADGSISALARQPDGKILVGGDFSNLDGNPRARLARLNANGSIDPTFNPGTGADRTIYDVLVLPDGKILVAGLFTTFNGTPREYLVRLNEDGSVDPGFTGPDFGGTSGWWVRSLALQADGRVLVAGVFFFSGTNQRASLCRLNANGSLDPTFNGIVQGASAAFTGTSLGELRKVDVLPDGTILICGTLITYNQTSRRGIARLAANGAIDPTFDPGTGGDQPVDTFLAQPDGRIIIGGRFTSFNGTAANRLARLNANGSVDTTFASGTGLTAAVNALAAQADGNILVGGSVSTFQGSSVTRPVWRFLLGTGAPVTTTPTHPQTPGTGTPAVSEVGRLVNMSIRTNAGTGDNTLIVGVGLGGAGTAGTKAVLFRAIGPTLAAFGVSGALADSIMSVYQGTTLLVQNDDWAGGFDFSSVGAFNFSGATPRDAAVYNSATSAGSYSIQIAGKNNTTGIALAEIYDATPRASFTSATLRLVNVSARTMVGTGDNILIAGFVVAGSTPVRVLVRAAGPTLGAFGVSGSLADPRLELFSAAATRVAENDNWGGTAELKAAFSSVAAFAFSADNSRDSALVSTLQPGSYTAQVSGVANTTGVALIEIYEVP